MQLICKIRITKSRRRCRACTPELAKGSLLHAPVLAVLRQAHGDVDPLCRSDSAAESVVTCNCLDQSRSVTAEHGIYDRIEIGSESLFELTVPNLSNIGSSILGESGKLGGEP